MARRKRRRGGSQDCGRVRVSSVNTEDRGVPVFKSTRRSGKARVDGHKIPSSQQATVVTVFRFELWRGPRGFQVLAGMIRAMLPS